MAANFWTPKKFLNISKWSAEQWTSAENLYLFTPPPPPPPPPPPHTACSTESRCAAACSRVSHWRGSLPTSSVFPEADGPAGHRQRAKSLSLSKVLSGQVPPSFLWISFHSLTGASARAAVAAWRACSGGRRKTGGFLWGSRLHLQRKTISNQHTKQHPKETTCCYLRSTA